MNWKFCLIFKLLLCLTDNCFIPVFHSLSHAFRRHLHTNNAYISMSKVWCCSWVYSQVNSSEQLTFPVEESRAVFLRCSIFFSICWFLSIFLFWSRSNVDFIWNYNSFQNKFTVALTWGALWKEKIRIKNAKSEFFWPLNINVLKRGRICQILSVHLMFN